MFLDIFKNTFLSVIYLILCLVTPAGCASLARTSLFGVNFCTLSPVRTPRVRILCRESTKEKTLPEGNVLSLVNLTGADSETFYRDLEELADKLAAQEDHNV